MQKAINELTESVARSPIMSLLLVIFLVQSYIMVTKLDKINDTLVNIHKDNLIVQQYTQNEAQDTKQFISRMEAVENKLEVILQIVKRAD